MGKKPAKSSPKNGTNKGAVSKSSAEDCRPVWPPSPTCRIEHLPMVKVSEMFLINSTEKSKKFEIKDDTGKSILNAEANGGCFFCRFTNIKLFGIPQKNELIHLKRPFACSKCWCLCCCLQKLIVSAPAGCEIGSIEKQWGCKPNFLIKNDKGETVFRVRAPYSAFCNSKTDFRVEKPNGCLVAIISKRLPKLAKELFQSKEIFGIDFYISLDVWMKTMLLATTFLVNYLYFECC